jgi:glycosyltransferase involved in cell wall biosynthesis
MASFGPGYPVVLSWAFAMAERRCAHFTDFLISVGEDLRDRYLMAGVGRRDQYSIVRSPVGVEAFLQTRRLRNGDRVALKRKLGLPTEGSVLIAAGLLEKRKRIDVAISKLAPLLAGGSALLIVAGAGPERQKLEELAQRDGIASRLRFIGHVNNLHEYFATSDLLVQTSLAEGLPQVVVQALASGLPVVATSSEGLSELQPAPLTCLQRNGEGLLAACESSLASAKPEPIPAERLAPWTLPAVQQARAAVHDRICEAVRVRKSQA